jgi:hypothetical protein
MGAPPDPQAGPEAKPEAKRRRHKRAEGPRSGSSPEQSFRRPLLDAEGRERPLFLLDYPEDPDLEQLIAAFEAGDYAYVRENASGLAERSTDPDVKRAADELYERTTPDPLAKYLLVLAIVLLVILVAFAYTSHRHG